MTAPVAISVERTESVPIACARFDVSLRTSITHLMHRTTNKAIVHENGDVRNTANLPIDTRAFACGCIVSHLHEGDYQKAESGVKKEDGKVKQHDSSPDSEESQYLVEFRLDLHCVVTD